MGFDTRGRPFSDPIQRNEKRRIGKKARKKIFRRELKKKSTETNIGPKQKEKRESKKTNANKGKLGTHWGK